MVEHNINKGIIASSARTNSYTDSGLATGPAGSSNLDLTMNMHTHTHTKSVTCCTGHLKEQVREATQRQPGKELQKLKWRA